MNINFKKGDKISVSAKSINNGYDPYKKRAKSYLVIGRQYTIDKITIMTNSISIKVVEVPNVVFDAINFDLHGRL